jgi:GDP-4-dehydro-6-deoxy-D-mannose reductase
MRILVTGAAGFTGNRMMEYLTAQGAIEPVGLIRRSNLMNERETKSFIVADLLAPESLHTAIAGFCPDAVIHLAGLTRGTSEALHAANVTGTKNLLDATVAANPACRILVISSSAVYGYAGDLPIPETAPLRSISDYGKSKVAQEELAMSYNPGDAAIAVTRPFNLVGPGQIASFVCGRIVNQVISIERGEKETLDLWEISSSRDLIDVRDIVRGYWALVSRPDFASDCSRKVFNLGSGSSYRISEIISIVEEITGEHYNIQLPDAVQDAAIPTQRSDNSRITALTGWKPIIPLKETLRDMLDYERKKREQ